MQTMLHVTTNCLAVMKTAILLLYKQHIMVKYIHVLKNTDPVMII